MNLRYLHNKDGGKIVAQRGRAMRGFTLIELVVVIGLILILVGLTMAVGVAIRAKSEARETENVLVLLDQAVKQWELAADRQLSWGTENQPVNGAVYDIDEFYSADEQLTQLLGRISTNQSAKDILAQIDNDFLQQEDDNGDTFLKLVDPWGTQIRLIHPGRLPDPANYPGEVVGDIDGTIRTSYEDDFGIAVNRILLFVSAGPDGDFGDLQAQADTPDFKATRDNVYSYQPVSIE